MFHGDADAATAAGLLELKDRIKRCKIAPSKLDATVNIATWNIREFGKKPRLKKSLHYIAEILGQFDLIGVVEVRENVDDLCAAMRIMGPYWRVIYSDFIEDAGGNRERVAYVYDSRAVEFTGLAGNANEGRKKKEEDYIPERSWWRKPFMASFRAGSFDFIMLTTHIRWGSIEKKRIGELELLAEYVKRRAESPNAIDKDVIVMGDFNIPSLTSPLYKAVVRHGLQMPAALAGAHGSNLAKDKRYDQILHNPVFTKSFSALGGVLDFFGNGWGKLYPEAKSQKDDAFTYELSDHMPLWLQLRTDISEEVLDQKLNPRPAGAPKRDRDGS
jgi:hypothetical protein